MTSIFPAVFATYPERPGRLDVGNPGLNNLGLSNSLPVSVGCGADAYISPIHATPSR